MRDRQQRSQKRRWTRSQRRTSSTPQFAGWVGRRWGEGGAEERGGRESELDQVSLEALSAVRARAREPSRPSLLSNRPALGCQDAPQLP